MKRTIELYKPEHYHFADGTELHRDRVTVEPFGKTIDGKRGEVTVWADVEDDSCLYLIQCGVLWPFDGEVY